jgi:hypothetical protein
MLPNFKIVIGGILIFVLLFAVTGAGVVTPQTYTRVGAMPEVGRPMMQRVIADESAQLSTSLRRGDELRVHELATLVAIPEPQAAPERDEQAMIERDADEKSDAVTEPIVAAIAADSASAAPPPSGPDSIAAPPPVLSARADQVAATTAAPTGPGGAARPNAAVAAESIADADRAKPAANAPQQARLTSRQGTLDADLTKPGDGNHSANSDVPKPHHRIAAHARKRLAAAHRVRQATPAATYNPAVNFFGQPSFQTHF